MNFITVENLKARLNVKSLSLVDNEETGKCFIDAGNSRSLKVQQDIDVTKPMKFMYGSEDTFDEGCLTNVKPSTITVRHTF